MKTRITAGFLLIRNNSISYAFIARITICGREVVSLFHLILLRGTFLTPKTVFMSNSFSKRFGFIVRQNLLKANRA